MKIKYYTQHDSKIGRWAGSKRLKSIKKMGAVLNQYVPLFFNRFSAAFNPAHRPIFESCWVYLAILLAFKLFASYQDEELARLWSAIGDMNHPTLEEYRLIDQYLGTGERKYLDLLRYADPPCPARLKRIIDLKLTGPDNGLPIYEKYAFNIEGSSMDRCIVLYGSSNGIYPKKARKLLAEIENSGYSGHVLLRIGGFPNTQFGGLEICHVPYSFKVAFLQEARLLGFKQVLWIDLAIHPLCGFETVFSEIERRGHFFTTVGSLQDNFPTHLPKAAEALNITQDLYVDIPHISSSMIGLNMEDSRAIQLLETWYNETGNLYSSMTWWPEELSLSVSAWRLGCEPLTWFGNLVCAESEQFQLETRPNVQFYLDGLR